MSSLIHSSSTLAAKRRMLPTIRLSPRTLNRLSRNSRSAAMAWCTHASISPTYRRGSCACISIGRGRPPGPPRVNALVNAVSSVSCLVCDRYVRASLRHRAQYPIVAVSAWERTSIALGALGVCARPPALRVQPLVLHHAPSAGTRSSTSGIFSDTPAPCSSTSLRECRL